MKAASHNQKWDCFANKEFLMQGNSITVNQSINQFIARPIWQLKGWITQSNK